MQPICVRHLADCQYTQINPNVLPKTGGTILGIVGGAMLRSEQKFSAPLPEQVAFWNQWNAEFREQMIDRVSIDQGNLVARWLQQLGRKDLDILEVGCGAGWLCDRLRAYGAVTATDLSHEVLKRAAARSPEVKFVAGDFMLLDFQPQAYDVIVSLEVLSHVADQPAFITKLASLLRPGGYLMLATQNRPQLERNDIPRPRPGQIRQWVDRHELARLLKGEFDVMELRSITPQCNRGILRVVNSRKLHTQLANLGLGWASRLVTSAQEEAWLGWTLMCLARKPANGA